MRILVSGSLRDVPEEQHEQLREAARELGKCLGAAGHTVLVATQDHNDVDPYVVDGFMTAAKMSNAEVHLMKGAAKCYSDQSTVKNIWHRYSDWDLTVLEVVRYSSDAVIVMAGRKGVVQAGIAGWMLGYFAYETIAKPILEFYGKLEEFEALRTSGGFGFILLMLVTSGVAHLPPIKVVTILSGVMHVNLWLFIISAVVARGARFYFLAWLLRTYGEPIRHFIEQRLGLIAAAGATALILLYIIVRYVF
jgi:membrane protein YqaA with SNARE-associated domain